MASLDYYIDLFSNLPVNKTKSKTAPHKAVLLITIMKMIEREEIDSSFIPLSDNLIRNFKRVWKAYVPLPTSYVPRLAYPFFHLSSSPFWELIKRPDCQEQREYSTVKALQRDYEGALIDMELYQMMKDPSSREMLIGLLKETYLGVNKESSISSKLLGIASLVALICSVA